MQKLRLLLFSICWIAAVGQSAEPAAGKGTSPKLIRLAKIELSKNKFKKTKIGGLSGAFFIGDRLYALSDDRGRVNEPRFYVFKVKMKSEKSGLQVEVDPENVIFIKTGKEKKSAYLDGESFISLDEKTFLISSEGDNNHKPRREPRLFEIDPQGNFLKNWVLPKEIIPESTGMQKIGIGNNSGIEGLTLSADGLSVLAAVERPLVQDSDPEEHTVRFYEYDKTETTKVKSQYKYSLSNVGLFSGISEILSWKERKYFVLERGARLELSGQVYYDSALSLIDLNEIEKSEKHPGLLRKYSIEAQLGDENFETMAWGPAWGEYPRTLWILNDNNFSKIEKNVVLVYGVSEAPEKKNQ